MCKKTLRGNGLKVKQRRAKEKKELLEEFEIKFVPGFRIRKNERVILKENGPISYETGEYIRFLEKKFNSKWGIGRYISEVLGLGKNYLSDYREDDLISRIESNRYFYYLESLSVIIGKRIIDNKLEVLSQSELEELERLGKFKRIGKAKSEVVQND